MASRTGRRCFELTLVSLCRRYFNVIGSDPEGRLGEAPRAELRHHGRISGACFDAAMGKIDGLKVGEGPQEMRTGEAKSRHGGSRGRQGSCCPVSA